MEKALRVLNELEKEGVIARYAIGGGIAGLFYMEPLLTYDLDVFVFLPKPAGKLIDLSSLYGSLRRKGYPAQREHVVIEGVPVQFIPAYNDLVEEAVRESVQRLCRKTETRVLRVEHLLAIMLQTDRPKDRARMVQLLEEATVDKSRLAGVLKRHGLRRKWGGFKRRFYGE